MRRLLSMRGDASSLAYRLGGLTETHSGRFWASLGTAPFLESEKTASENYKL
jgi:hypothetical protein